MNDSAYIDSRTGAMTSAQPKTESTPTDFTYFTNTLNKTRDFNITENLNKSNVTIFTDYPEGLLNFGATCFIVFAIVGGTGNFVSILALSRNKKIRNATTSFIVNLCVADFLFCTFSMPFSAIKFIEKDWRYGDTLCVLFPLVRYSNGAVSLFSILAITVNRYILIAHPKIYDSVYTKGKVALMIFSMWMLSLLFLMLPLLGVWGKLGYDSQVGTCTIVEAANGRSPKTFFFTAAFILPSAIFIACYLRIYFVVKKGSKNTQRTLSSDTLSMKKGFSNKTLGINDLRLFYKQQRKKKELKVLKVMLVIFILYILCYFPAFIVKMSRKESDLPILNVLGYVGVYFSSIINPLIYIVMSDVYRQAYKELFCRSRAKDVTCNSNSSRPRIV